MKRSSLSETDLKSMDASNHDTDEWLRVDESDIPLFLESRIEVVSTLATDAVNLAAHHRAEFLSVFFMMISPSVVMVFCLFFLRSIIAAMFGYHVISCISGPALYISFRFGSSQLLKISSQCISKELKIQLLAGFVYFAIIAIGGVCMYWAIGHTIIPNKLDIVEELGLSTDPLFLCLFSLYFCIVNPFLEEIFWREFILRTLGTREVTLWLTSCFYALYHVFVLSAMEIDFELCMACFVGLIVFGRILCLLTKKTGVFSAFLAHSAGDVVIVAVMWDWYVNWIQ